MRRRKFITVLGAAAASAVVRRKLAAIFVD
jgi:hypothetical protein